MTKKPSAAFDPNSASAEGSGVFGLPHSEQEAALVLLPVPWEATTSYGGGTSRGPEAIREASYQVDLFDGDVLKPYEAGLFMRESPRGVAAWNRQAKRAAAPVIRAGGADGSKRLAAAARKVNALSGRLNAWVHSETKALLGAGTLVGVVGGDHSTPLGAMKAASEKHPGLGLLHFDAHHDLRIAYEGFEHSHASILYNVLKECPGVSKLVQVGIRDFCEQEVEVVREQGPRVKVFYDRDLFRAKADGRTWAQQAKDIVNELPSTVWVTFDIDGLDPRFCPNTGTPVPGGLDFNEANHILGEVVRSGRRLVGFDLNEVSPGPKGPGAWDANVGARLLYKLCAWTLASNGLAKLR